MDEKRRESEMSHQLTLNNRNLLSIDGVSNLGSYEQDLILLETNAGVLEIKGDRLHIQQLNIDQGKVVVDGDIFSLVYSEGVLSKKGKSFLGKLIK